LLRRSARGVELTEAGKAFIDHARLAIAQVDAATASARRAATPAKPRLALGFLTDQETTWLTAAMHLLREELPNIEVTVSSDYSTELAVALSRGELGAAFMRAESGFGLDYRQVGEEPLVVLMPSDHPLTARRRCIRMTCGTSHSLRWPTRPRFYASVSMHTSRGRASRWM
jgi:LysR family transcriptional regulator, hca operon transcriptional activator